MGPRRPGWGLLALILLCVCGCGPAAPGGEAGKLLIRADPDVEPAAIMEEVDRKFRTHGRASVEIYAAPDTRWAVVHAAAEAAFAGGADPVRVRVDGPNGPEVLPVAWSRKAGSIGVQLAPTERDDAPMVTIEAWKGAFQSERAASCASTRRFLWNDLERRDRAQLRRAVSALERNSKERRLSPRLLRLEIPYVEEGLLTVEQVVDAMDAVRDEIPTTRVEIGPGPGSTGGKRVDGVVLALKWFPLYQASDGAWRPGVSTPRCDPGPRIRQDLGGDPERAVAVTGVVLMAYVGSGYTNRGKHPFRKTVTSALRFLREHQAADGRFGAGPVDHLPVLAAFLLLHPRTRSPVHAKPCARGIAWLADNLDAVDDDPWSQTWLQCVVRSIDETNADWNKKGEEPPFDALSVETECPGVPELPTERTPLEWLRGIAGALEAGGDEYRRWKKDVPEYLASRQSMQEALCWMRGGWPADDSPADRMGGRLLTSALNTLTLQFWYRYEVVPRRLFACTR